MKKQELIKRVAAVGLSGFLALSAIPVAGLAGVVTSPVLTAEAAASANAKIAFISDTQNDAHFMGLGTLTVTGGDDAAKLANLNAAASVANSGGTFAKTGTSAPILYIKKGKTATFSVTFDDEGLAQASELNKLKVPAGVNVTMGKLEKGAKDGVLSITADQEVKCDLNATPNVQLEFGGFLLNFYVGSGNFTQSITSKDDTFDLSVGETKSVTAMLAKMKADGLDATEQGAIATANAGTDSRANKALIAGGAGESTYSMSDALVDIVNFKDTSGATVKDVTNIKTWTHTLSAKKDKLGATGTFTVTNPSWKFNKGDSDWEVEVEKATKTFTVNVKNTVNATSDTLKVGTDVTENYDIPFKALVNLSGDVNASEVDSNEEALSSSTGKVKIDNDKKVITIVAKATGSTSIKFSPKDSSKNGKGKTVTLNFDASVATSKKTTVSTVLTPGAAASSWSGTFPDATNDAWSFNFEKDGIETMITVATTLSSGYVSAATLKAEEGVPGGTYVAYETLVDGASANLLAFREVNIVVSGASKDAPANIGVKKINDKDNGTYTDYAGARTVITRVKNNLGPNGNTVSTSNKYTLDQYNAAINVYGGYKASALDCTTGSTYNTFAETTQWIVSPYKNITLLSGVDSTLEITSPVAAAELVSDLSLGTVALENASTGARVTDGLTVDGMKVTIASSNLEAGKGYYLFVTTKGSGISESDSMTKTDGNCIYIDVKQGYTYNYNIGGAQVKAGKTLKTVSISSTESTEVKLEDGSNLEYPGATFLGWSFTEGATKADIPNTDAKGGLTAAQIKTSIDKAVGGTINIYAVWDFVTYTMKNDLNGGTGKSIAQRTFNVGSTDVVLPTTADGYAKGSAPLIGWTVTASGKSSAGAALTVYPGGTLSASQLSQIVKENDPDMKKTEVTMYAQYGKALKAVTITPATTEVELGKTTKVTATAIDEDGVTSSYATITYVSSNPAIATVAEDGTVTPVAIGEVSITATATIGTTSLSTTTPAVVTVKEAAQPAAKKANTLTVKPATKKFKYAAVKKAKKTFTIKAKKAQGKVTYTAAAKAKKAGVTVNAKGKVTVKKGTKKGTYKITVKAAGNDNYKAGKKTVKVIIK